MMMGVSREERWENSIRNLRNLTFATSDAACSDCTSDSAVFDTIALGLMFLAAGLDSRFEDRH